MLQSIPPSTPSQGGKSPCSARAGSPAPAEALLERGGSWRAPGATRLRQHEQSAGSERDRDGAAGAGDAWGCRHGWGAAPGAGGAARSARGCRHRVGWGCSTSCRRCSARDHRAGQVPAGGAGVPMPYPARCPRSRPGAVSRPPTPVPVLTRRGRCRCCRTPCGCRPGSSPPPRCAAGRWAA